MTITAANLTAATAHVLSAVPFDGRGYHDLAPYGFTGWEGFNEPGQGEAARGFTYRRKSVCEGQFFDDRYQYDHANYGPVGSHWARAAADIRKSDEAMRAYLAADEDGVAA